MKDIAMDVLTVALALWWAFPGVNGHRSYIPLAACIGKFVWQLHPVVMLLVIESSLVTLLFAVVFFFTTKRTVLSLNKTFQNLGSILIVCAIHCAHVADAYVAPYVFHFVENGALCFIGVYFAVMWFLSNTPRPHMQHCSCHVFNSTSINESITQTRHLYTAHPAPKSQEKDAVLVEDMGEPACFIMERAEIKSRSLHVDCGFLLQPNDTTASNPEHDDKNTIIALWGGGQKATQQTTK